MDSPITDTTILTYEGSNGEIHGELLMGECVPGNCSSIGMGGGGGYWNCEL